jgi:hypothetical protein
MSPGELWRLKNARPGPASLFEIRWRTSISSGFGRPPGWSKENRGPCTTTELRPRLGRERHKGIVLDPAKSFSDAELQKWWANPDAAILNRVYDAFDGAQPNIGSFNAAASTADGCVWFSNGIVVQMLDPSRIAEPVTAPAASIESVIVDRKEVAGFNNLRIGPHPRELQIDYTSPTFSVPQRVTFRYKLDGYDDSWHDAGPRRWAGDRYRDDAAAAGGQPLRLAGHARARGDRQRAARRPKRSRRRHRDRASRSGGDRVLDVCAPRVVAANPRLAWPFPSFEAAASTNRAWRAARLAYRTHSTRLI